MPYLHNENPESPYYLEYISYENEISITEKCIYIKENQLGGIMLWELGLDTWTEDWAAISAIEEEFAK